MMPIGGKRNTSISRKKENQLELTSESILGREPSYSECIQYMQQHFGSTVGKDWLIDNGC